jgi:hypothetical protein
MAVCTDVLFKVGARVLLSGASGAGKTKFLMNVIRRRADLFEVPPTRLLYASKMTLQQIRELGFLDRQTYGMVDFIEEVPPDEYTFQPYTLLVLDDLLSGSDVDSVAEKMLAYFCRRAHHEKIYCFVTVQNLYTASKHFRTLSLNANYLVLFKSHRNLAQIRFLAQQILAAGSGGTRILSQIYKDAVNKSPYGYLLIDFHPQTDEKLRFKTNVLEENQEPCIVYKIDDAI